MTTLYPLSLMRLTISPWWRALMSTWLTARMRSPTCSRPHRSAGEPAMMRPMVEPARLAEEMMTKPKPSLSRRVTVTSYGYDWEEEGGWLEEEGPSVAEEEPGAAEVRPPL